VSSYGISGTNVHAIVEQAPEQAPEATAPEDISAESSTTAPLLFPLSSTSADELHRTAGRLADWVQAHDDVALPDLAYTLARRRARRPVRTAVIASSQPELTEALREVADGDTPYPAAVGRDDRGPVWVFSGQGSQWAQMGAELLATEPVFAATVAQAEPLIARESGFSVTHVDPRSAHAHAAVATRRMLRPEPITGYSSSVAIKRRVRPALAIQPAVSLTCHSHSVVA
jgi:polyketide synthase 5